jgi:hypothetical protein
MAEGGLILEQHNKTIEKMIAHLHCTVLLSVDMASSSFNGNLKRLNAPTSPNAHPIFVRQPDKLVL